MELGSSRQLLTVLGVAHVGAVPCAFATDLPAAIQAALAVGVLLHAARCLANHALRRGPRAIVLLVWDRDGRWRLVQRDGRVLDGQLDHGACVHPRLLVLPFRILSGGRRCVLIPADAVTAGDMRRLRTRLRCEPPGES
jgi:hypothetical protein